MPDQLNISDDHEINAQTFLKIITEYLSEESKLYIIIGSDAGIFPNTLENFQLPDGSRYLFVETNERFQEAAENIIDNGPSPVYLANEDTWQNTLHALEIERYIYTEKMLILKSAIASTVLKDYYNPLYESINNQITTLYKKLKTETNQDSFLKNKLLNLVDNIQPASLLRNNGEGTALVLGAGPSLDEKIEWIKDNRSRLTIIAVSRIYQLLQQNKIKPDIIVSVDPQDINYEQGRSMLSEKESIFVHSNYVSPRLIAQWPGPSLYMDNLYPWEHKDNIEDNIKVADPTVSHSAIQLAMDMGYEQILLLGIDLCFKESESSHAGSIDEANKDIDNTLVQTYQGEMAKTSFFMKLGIEYMEDIIKGYNGKIYNLSKDAAIVNGISFIKPPTLANIIPKKLAIEIPTNKQRQEHIKKIKNEISTAQIKINEFKKSCKEALNLNILPNSNINEEKYNRNRTKIDKIEKKISTKFSTYLPMLQKIASAELVRLLKQTDKKEKSLKEIHEWLDNYYSAYIKASDIILDFLIKSKAIIQYRLLEFSTPPNNLSKIIDYWQHYQIIGRSCFFGDQKQESNDSKKILLDVCIQFKHELSFPRPHQYILDELNITDLSEIVPNKIKYIESISSENNTNSNLSGAKIFEIFLEGIILQYNNKKIESLEKYFLIPGLLYKNPQHFTQYIEKGLLKILIYRIAEIDIIKAFEMIEEIKQVFLKIKCRIQLKEYLIYLLNNHILIDWHTPLTKHVLIYIHDAFTHHDKNSLALLLKKINASYEQNNYFNWSKLLIKGVQHQLDGRLKDAKTNYTTILNGLIPDGKLRKEVYSNPSLEATLLQMLTLSNHRESIDIYNILCQISHNYKPKYAQYLSKVGKINAAINLYIDYLQKNPSDTHSLIELGNLYKENGKPELSEQILEIAIKQTSGESTANKYLKQLDDSN